MKGLIEWLLQGEAFVEYRTRVDLLGQSENEPAVLQAKAKMMQDPRIQLILQELKAWPGTVLNSHKSASQPFHKLSFIADIGLTKDDPNVNAIVQKRFLSTNLTKDPSNCQQMFLRILAVQAMTLGHGRCVTLQSSFTL